MREIQMLQAVWISLSLLFSCDYCFVSFKVLIGNDDKNSEVKHVVYGMLTRYLRFRPQTNQGRVCMRTEVFGVKQKPSEFEI